MPAPIFSTSVVNNRSDWEISGCQVNLENINVEKSQAKKKHPKPVEFLREEATSELIGNELSGFDEK